MAEAVRRVDQAVRGGLGGELAHGGEMQVDRGRRELALGEMRAVTLDRRPCEAFPGGVGRVPGKELFERAARTPGGNAGWPESRGRARPGPPARAAPSFFLRTLSCPLRSSEAVPRQLQLPRRAGVLLGPQIGEQLGDPAVDGAEPVQARVAGAAEGDQVRGPVGGPAMMDDQRLGGVADAAVAAVAGQDPVTLAGEAGAVTPASVVAELAQSAAVEVRRSAGGSTAATGSGVRES